MFKGTVLCVQRNDAMRHVASNLQELGICITDKCAPDVTHLLLPVPSFSGGDGYLAHLLTKLPDDLIISGGNLSSPLLAGHRSVDFLQDPLYLAHNAAITARCAAGIVEEHLEKDLSGKNILVAGWGADWEMSGSTIGRPGWHSNCRSKELCRPGHDPGSGHQEPQYIRCSRRD